IWPCSRWGLPSQPVARLLVGSYPAFSPLPFRRVSGEWSQAMSYYSPLTTHSSEGGILSVALSRSFFSRHLGNQGRLNRTVGVTHHRVLWSPDFPLPGPSHDSPKRIERLSRAATVRPACGSSFIILCCRRTIHTKSVSVAQMPRTKNQIPRTKS